MMDTWLTTANRRLYHHWSAIQTRFSLDIQSNLPTRFPLVLRFCSRSTDRIDVISRSFDSTCLAVIRPGLGLVSLDQLNFFLKLTAKEVKLTYVIAQIRMEIFQLLPCLHSFGAPFSVTFSVYTSLRHATHFIDNNGAFLNMDRVC